MWNPWQSVKCINDRSEFFGRAGRVVRSEKDGAIVEMDATETKPKEVITFANEEIQAL